MRKVIFTTVILLCIISFILNIFLLEKNMILKKEIDLRDFLIVQSIEKVEEIKKKLTAPISSIYKGTGIKRLKYY